MSAAINNFYAVLFRLNGGELANQPGVVRAAAQPFAFVLSEPMCSDPAHVITQQQDGFGSKMVGKVNGLIA